MSHDPALDRDLCAVPVKATAQWLALRAALAAVGPVPCQTSDPEAWWPDAKDAHGPAARMAVEACRRCEAAPPCLAYALASDHRYGIWGATLAEERRAMRWEVVEDGERHDEPPTASG